MSSPGTIPDLRGEVIISIGPDGRLYFHDLDPDLIEVALSVNPDDGLMRRRLGLCPRAREAARKEGRP